MNSRSPLARRTISAVVAAVLLGTALLTRAAAPAGRYTVGSDMATVYDTKTGLTWQRAVPSGTYTWGNALTASTAQNYCASLSLDGGGWRVPTMKELTTIVDYSVASPGPTIDGNAFPNTPASYFWSSTPAAGSSGSAWYVRFDYGYTYDNPVKLSYNVRCVR